MSRDKRQTWKHDMSSLLDLSAWKRDGDIGMQSDVTKVEHLEVDKLLLCTKPKHLTCTAMVAFIGIWLNWHNPGDDPACPDGAHCDNALVHVCVPAY